MFQRILVVCCWILALLLSAPAQTVRRKPRPVDSPKEPVTIQSSAPLLRQNEPVGWAWVTQTLDLSKQYGGEENIFTLDGAPPPSLLHKRVTLGLVIDDQGHIVTRLIDVNPSNPPVDLTVRVSGGIPTKAKFIGMDTVTGFCVIKIESGALKQANFDQAGQSNLLPQRLNIRLFGFHPNQVLGTSARLAMNVETPRCNFFPGEIVKAAGDFRYNASNPIYYLLNPQITPAQDGSLIIRNGAVFGIAYYDTGSQNKHLIYPVSRVQTIAEYVIKSNQSIAYGWLGATGSNVYAPIQTQLSKPEPVELGVRILAIAPDSPAEKAGIRAQDILLGLNDRRIENREQLASVIRQIPADSDITLRIKRSNEYKTVKAKLVPAPAADPEQLLFAYARRLDEMKGQLKVVPVSDPARQNLEARVNQMSSFFEIVIKPAPPEVRLRVFYGFEVEALTGQLMNYFAVTNGLLVANVLEGNKAAQAGLKAGDVIVSVGDVPITNLATLSKALDEAQGEAIEITLSRRREIVKLALLH